MRSNSWRLLFRGIQHYNRRMQSGGRSILFLSNQEEQNNWWRFSAFGFSTLGWLVGSNLIWAEDIRTEPYAANDDAKTATISMENLYSTEEKSNSHTAKWRVFTNLARDLFSQGKLDEAESYFRKALEEAEVGFGERDPHVASALNNLAEFLRVKRDYQNAEPLYIEAVKILEQSMGAEHESVGFALHNLAGFYLLQNKLNLAYDCYERSLKIKGKMQGKDHPDYANTMFHLAEVLRLQGKLKDALALMEDSLRIFEVCGLHESKIAIKRMTRLAQILADSGQLQEAEALQRKVVNTLELLQDPNPSSVVVAMEALAMIVEKLEKFDECEKLLQRCLDLKRKARKPNNLQVHSSLLKLAKLAIHQGDKLALKDKLKAKEAYDRSELLLLEAVRMAEENWKNFMKTYNKNERKSGRSVEASPLFKHCFLALVGSLNMLGLIGIRKLELGVNLEPSENNTKDAEDALRRALSLFQDPQFYKMVGLSLEVKKEYMDCLQFLAKLLGTKNSTKEKYKDEIQTILHELDVAKSRSSVKENLDA